MSTSRTMILAALVSVSLMAVDGSAELFQQNDARFGPNSLTRDTRTGLVWLDLPFSSDLSYLQVEAATQAGGQFEGFRHATADEVLSLYLSAGFGEGFIPESSSSFQNVVSFVSLLGATSATGAAGITGTLFNDSSLALAYMSYGASAGIPGYFVTTSLGTPETLSTHYGPETHFSTVGNWIVVVPEPSTSAVLIIAGALALRSIPPAATRKFRRPARGKNNRSASAATSPESA